MGLAAGVVGIPRIRIERCRIVTKVVGGLRPGTSCVFPLRFCRKAISVSVVALIDSLDGLLIWKVPAGILANVADAIHGRKLPLKLGKLRSIRVRRTVGAAGESHTGGQSRYNLGFLHMIEHLLLVCYRNLNRAGAVACLTGLLSIVLATHRVVVDMTFLSFVVMLGA